MLQGIPAVFYPTTTLIVDDQVPFLSAVRNSLGDTLPIESYDSPQEAIATANKRGIGQRLSSNCLENMADSERFRTVSVVVADYRMPEMTGVELFKQLRGHPAKKIILTGQMDNGSAVSLFNDQLIDRFIEKGHDDMMDELGRYIFSLQLDKMIGRSMAILSADKSLNDLSQDPALCEWFWRFRDQNSFIEHYRIPEGFLVVDRDGAVSMLLLQTQAELDEAHARAETALKAPRSVVDRLRSREVMLHQPNPVLSVNAAEAEWEPLLHPARQVLGDRDVYFYSLVSETTPYPDRVELSLEDHLRDLFDASFA